MWWELRERESDREEVRSERLAEAGSRSFPVDHADLDLVPRAKESVR